MANWSSNPTTGNNSWRRQDDGIAGNWNGTGSGIVSPLTGAGCADFHSYFAPNGSKGSLDLYVNLSAINYTLSFYYKNVSGSDSMVLFLSTDGGSTFAKKAGYTINTNWTKHTMNLGAVNSSSCILRFMATSDYGNSDIAIDSLQIKSPCVTPTLMVVSSPSVICSGDSVMYSVSGSNTYSWSTGTNSSTLSIKPTVSATYTITGSNGSGCTTTQTVSVLVNPNPTLTVSGASVICAGNQSSLTLSGAASYSWNAGGSGSVVAVSPSVTSTYTISSTNAQGCSDTQTISISVNPSPTITVDSTSIICAGSSTSFTASGATSYSWSTGDSTSVVVISPTVTSTYTILGTSALGCTGSVTVNQVVSNCTGIDGHSANTTVTNVFPNPTTGEVTLQLTAGAKKIDVCDLTGKVILSDSTSKDKAHVDLSPFGNGIYFVKIYGNNAVEVIKIIKQK